eukprot:TRINITY_DN80773_c0_g1_i1.p1 TRINITY_DN80773_c0_g1~~TRINITY_DN80773_c0_g1_i1.p1  ORF type:complete len:229 (-),score=13.03 TRINITY_DN80773_c0_g1_i1:192-878(-)
MNLIQRLGERFDRLTGESQIEHCFQGFAEALQALRQNGVTVPSMAIFVRSLQMHYVMQPIEGFDFREDRGSAGRAYSVAASQCEIQIEVADEEAIWEAAQDLNSLLTSDGIIVRSGRPRLVRLIASTGLGVMVEQASNSAPAALAELTSWVQSYGPVFVAGAMAAYFLPYLAVGWGATGSVKLAAVFIPPFWPPDALSSGSHVNEALVQTRADSPREASSESNAGQSL